MLRTFAIACLLLAASAAIAQSKKPCSESLAFSKEARIVLGNPEIADPNVREIMLKDVCNSGQADDIKKKMIACVYRLHMNAIQASGQKLSTVDQMIQDGSMPDMPTCSEITPHTEKDQKNTQPHYGLTTEGLKKNIDDLLSKHLDYDATVGLIDLNLKTWRDSRLIASAAYEENLEKALDSWYLNNKDWRKISPELWNKLSERDRGRLKEGVDPEMMVLKHPLTQYGKTE